MICTVQLALSARGYEPGLIDCALGGQTKAALKLYQHDSGFPETGRLDARTLASLGIVE